MIPRHPENLSCDGSFAVPWSPMAVMRTLLDSCKLTLL
jgi:hypothetical protein